MKYQYFSLKAALFFVLSAFGLSAYAAGPTFGMANTDLTVGGDVPSGPNNTTASYSYSPGNPLLTGQLGYFVAPPCDYSTIFGVYIELSHENAFTYQVDSMGFQTPTLPPGITDPVFAWPYRGAFHTPMVLDQSYNSGLSGGSPHSQIHMFFGYTRCNSLLPPGYEVPYGNYYVDVHISGTYLDSSTGQTLPFTELITFQYLVISGSGTPVPGTPMSTPLSGRIEHYTNGGVLDIINTINAFQESTSSRKAPLQIPNLVEMYPNPVRDYAYFKLDLPTDSNVSLELFDVNGRMVRSIWEELFLQAQKHELKISLEDISPGVYFYRLELNGVSQTGKILKN